jgi:hypothetical protein
MWRKSPSVPGDQIPDPLGAPLHRPIGAEKVARSIGRKRSTLLSHFTCGWTLVQVAFLLSPHFPLCMSFSFSPSWLSSPVQIHNKKKLRPSIRLHNRSRSARERRDDRGMVKHWKDAMCWGGQEVVWGGHEVVWWPCLSGRSRSLEEQIKVFRNTHHHPSPAHLADKIVADLKMGC